MRLPGTPPFALPALRRGALASVGLLGIDIASDAPHPTTQGTRLRETPRLRPDDVLPRAYGKLALH